LPQVLKMAVDKASWLVKPGLVPGVEEAFAFHRELWKARNPGQTFEPQTGTAVRLPAA
jgi:hypothetical protein